MNDNDVDKMDIKEAYELFSSEVQPHTRIYHQARYGINLKFDIYDHFHNMMAIKEKSGIIIYRNQQFTMEEFWSEIEKRTILIKKWIKENLCNKSWQTAATNKKTAMPGVC